MIHECTGGTGIDAVAATDTGGFSQGNIQGGSDCRFKTTAYEPKCSRTYEITTDRNTLTAEDAFIIVQNNERMEMIKEQAIKDGMTTLKQDGIAKIFTGSSDLLQIRKVCIK